LLKSCKDFKSIVPFAAVKIEDFKEDLKLLAQP